MKFYPSDWRADPALRMCSVGARGLWMEMLCLMHEADPRGSLLVNGKVVSDAQLASLCGLPLKEAKPLIAELEDAGVFSREDNGTVYSRRMRRDVDKAARDKANGAKGGNPKVKGGVNPQDKAQKPEATSKAEASASDAAASAELSSRDRLWSEGPARLAEFGRLPADSYRSPIGKWLKAHDPLRILAAIDRAHAERSGDPVALVTRILTPDTGASNGKRTGTGQPSRADVRTAFLGEAFDAGAQDGELPADDRGEPSAFHRAAGGGHGYGRQPLRLSGPR